MSTKNFITQNALSLSSVDRCLPDLDQKRGRYVRSFGMIIFLKNIIFHFQIFRFAYGGTGFRELQTACSKAEFLNVMELKLKDCSQTPNYLVCELTSSHELYSSPAGRLRVIQKYVLSATRLLFLIQNKQIVLQV